MSDPFDSDDESREVSQSPEQWAERVLVACGVPADHLYAGGPVTPVKHLLEQVTARVVDELMAIVHQLRDSDGAQDCVVDRAAELDGDYAMTWIPGRGGVPCDD